MRNRVAQELMTLAVVTLVPIAVFAGFVMGTWLGWLDLPEFSEPLTATVYVFGGLHLFLLVLLWWLGRIWDFVLLFSLFVICLGVGATSYSNGDLVIAGAAFIGFFAGLTFRAYSNVKEV